MKCYKKWWLAVVLGIFIVIVNSFIVFGQDEESCNLANGNCILESNCNNDIISICGEGTHQNYVCCCLENYKDVNGKCVYDFCYKKEDGILCGTGKCMNEKCVPPCNKVNGAWCSSTMPENAVLAEGYCDNNFCVECPDYYIWDLQKCVKEIKCGKEPVDWGENIGDGCVQAYLSDKNAQVVGGQGATMYCQIVTGYSASECVKCNEGYGLISPNYASIGCEPIIKSGSCDAAGGECVEECDKYQIKEGYPYTECDSYKYDPYENKCKKCDPLDGDYEDCVNYYKKCVCCCQGKKFLNDDETKCVLCNPGTCNTAKDSYCKSDGSVWISFTKSTDEKGNCNDGIDNDCDGKIDLSDSDCLTGIPNIISGVYKEGTCRNGQSITLKCDVANVDSTADVRIWVGECTADNCKDTRSWFSGSGVIYHNNIKMEYVSGTTFKKTITISQPSGTAIAATCAVYEDESRLSDWGDAYPLCTVVDVTPGGIYCENPFSCDCGSLSQNFAINLIYNPGFELE